MKENFKKTKKRFLPLMSALALAVRIAVTENLKKIPNHMKQKTIVPALPFLLPSLFGVGVFYAVPFAVSVFFTFTQGVAHPHFAGLQNFRELWGTAVFRQALGNTVLFLTVGLCLLLALALFAALVCAKGRFAPQELALLLPMVIPVNSFALGWQSLWGQNGAVNRLLGLAGREPVDFLNGAAAFPLLGARYRIKNTGCGTRIFAAVIRALPHDYHAADRNAVAHQQLLFDVPGCVCAVRQQPARTAVYAAAFHERQFLPVKPSASQCRCAGNGAFDYWHGLVRQTLHCGKNGKRERAAAIMWKKGVRFRLQKLGLNLLAACCLLPVIFLLANSLCVGGTVSLTQYEDILLYQRPFYVWFWNSAAYTASTLAVSLPVSVLAGYGFSQFSFPGRNFLLGFYVLLMLMPFQATVVSQYLTLNALGLLDTPWAVIWPNAFQTFGVFMMTQFMASIDRELLQAARLDGAGHGTLFFRIVLPLCRPAVFSLLLLQFLACWSLIDQPLLFLKNGALYPLALELNSQTFGSSAYAAGAIYAVPPVLAYGLCRKYLTQGVKSL